MGVNDSIMLFSKTLLHHQSHPLVEGGAVGLSMIVQAFLAVPGPRCGAGGARRQLRWIC